MLLFGASLDWLNLFVGASNLFLILDGAFLVSFFVAYSMFDLIGCEEVVLILL